MSESFLKFFTPVFIKGDNPNKISSLSTAVTEILLNMLLVCIVSL